MIIAHCSSHWASFSLSLANLFADTICLALHLPAFFAIHSCGRLVLSCASHSVFVLPQHWSAKSPSSSSLPVVSTGSHRQNVNTNWPTAIIADAMYSLLPGVLCRSYAKRTSRLGSRERLLTRLVQYALHDLCTTLVWCWPFLSASLIN